MTANYRKIEMVKVRVMGGVTVPFLIILICTDSKFYIYIYK